MAIPIADFGVIWIMRDFSAVFVQCTRGFPEALICEAKVIVAKGDAGIGLEGGSELLNGVLGTVGILIGAAQQHVRKRVLVVKFHCGLQLMRGCDVVLRTEQHERQVEMCPEIDRA